LINILVVRRTRSLPLATGARMPIGDDRTLLEGNLELAGKVPAFLPIGVPECAV
jgi:hypothetical protein